MSRMRGQNRGHEYRETIPARLAGRSLLDHLTTRYPHSAAAAWLERIAAGRVLLDGNPGRPDDVLAPGQRLCWQRPPWREPAVPLSFALLHRDGNVLAVAKPRGLPTLPGGGRCFENTLLLRVRRLHPEAVPAHRLGTGTSGVVLFARTRVARQALAEAFRLARVERRYLGLVRGRPLADAFTIDLPIGPVSHLRLGSVMAAHPAGKPARSEVRVLERRQDSALVQVLIATGRSHQIRIHLAAAGFPLAGDPLYGPGGAPLSGSLAVPSQGGFHLHCRSLSFPDPAGGATIQVECHPPPILRQSGVLPG